MKFIGRVLDGRVESGVEETGLFFFRLLCNLLSRMNRGVEKLSEGKLQGQVLSDFKSFFDEESLGGWGSELDLQKMEFCLRVGTGSGARF